MCNFSLPFLISSIWLYSTLLGSTFAHRTSILRWIEGKAAIVHHYRNWSKICEENVNICRNWWKKKAAAVLQFLAFVWFASFVKWRVHVSLCHHSPLVLLITRSGMRTILTAWLILRSKIQWIRPRYYKTTSSFVLTKHHLIQIIHHHVQGRSTSSPWCIPNYVLFFIRL